MVATFGSDKPKQIMYQPTELQLTLKDGSSMLIEASVVPHISGRISCVPINSKNVSFLKSEDWKSKLADNLSSDSEHTSIELLIGNNYYLTYYYQGKWSWEMVCFCFNPNSDGFWEDGVLLLWTQPVCSVC